MPQIDPKDLDYSPMMKDFFENVFRRLKDYRKSDEEARALIDRFFTLDVTPLERALVMHRGVERVVRDLVGADSPGQFFSR